MGNYRMWAYSMIAVGLLNWDYQRSQQHVVVNSLVIIVPGILLIAFTFIPATKALLQLKLAKYAWMVIGIAALTFAFINK